MQDSVSAPGIFHEGKTRRDEQGGIVEERRLEGDLRVDQARALRDGLLELMSGAKRIVLDIGLLTSIDIAVLQVLISSFAEAARRHVELELEGDVGDLVREALLVSGISREPLFTASAMKECLSRAGDRGRPGAAE